MYPLGRARGRQLEAETGRQEAWVSDLSFSCSSVSPSIWWGLAILGGMVPSKDGPPGCPSFAQARFDLLRGQGLGSLLCSKLSQS